MPLQRDCPTFLLECLLDEQCVCDAGYRGRGCEEISCPRNCWNRGTCDYKTGTCQCAAWINSKAGVHSEKVANATKQDFMEHSEWVIFDEKSNCEFPKCALGCLGRGRCTKGRCDCDAGYTGKHCELQSCLFSTGRGPTFDCRSHGVCKDGACLCEGQGVEGHSCAWRSARSLGGSACSNKKYPHQCPDTVACVQSVGQCHHNWTGWKPWRFQRSPLKLTLANASSNFNMGHKAIDQQDIISRPYSFSSWRSSSTSSASHSFTFNGSRAEFISVDLGSHQEVGAVSLQRYLYAVESNIGTVTREYWQWKNVKDKWITFRSSSPSDYTIDYDVLEPFKARFVRFVFVLNPSAEKESNGVVNVWGIIIWGKDGPYPATTHFHPNLSPTRPSISEFLGVNGIWGFGTDTYSDNSTLWGNNERASAYGNGVHGIGMTNARNYHNMVI